MDLNSRILSRNNHISKISPMSHTLKIIDICKSNMKANRSSCIEQLRIRNKKEVATSIMEFYSSVNSNHQSKSNEDENDIENEDDIKRYLENEDYEYVLNQIMTELNDPSYEDIEDMDDYQHQHQGNDDSIVCPVCRVNLANYSLNTDILMCPCGLNLSLLHMPVHLFKCLLSDVFTNHHSSLALPCNADLKFIQTGFDTIRADCSHCGFLQLIPLGSR